MGEKRCAIGKKYDTVRHGGNYPVLVDMFTKKIRHGPSSGDVS